MCINFCPFFFFSLNLSLTDTHYVKCHATYWESSGQEHESVSTPLEVLA